MSLNESNSAEFADDIDLPNLVDSVEPELLKLVESDEKPDENVAVKVDHLSVLLSNYGESGFKLEEQFRQHNIEFNDLSALSDNDLKQFGVTDGNIRRQILKDFSEFLNQNTHYDEEMKSLNIEDYSCNALDHIRKHLEYTNIVVRGSFLKMQSDPPDDVYVTNELNATDLVLSTLEEMRKASNALEQELVNLTVNEKIIKTSEPFNYWKYLLVLGATAIGSAVLYKYYRIKLFKF
ncbi:hypothetical protein Bhyg_13060 [Pseudolycoriella hygida]|uniref:SAM domain-containing protein n=1 Tax=Pseudolycoriella hygida TaxID=35572 RepID=A0A9Q0N006_9DIPT|nr:hypothetical protein Bhyg_13060 [Pseudolycoriella hygida]